MPLASFDSIKDNSYSSLEESVISVLIVDDDRAFQKLVQRQLTHSQHSSFFVRSAYSLKEAIRLLERESIHVMLLDLHLPDSQGLATLQHVLKASRLLPVVVLSGTENDEIAIEAVKNGAQDYLVKGEVGPSLITRSLLYAVHRKRNEDTLRSSLEEKEILLREVHHRVKNNLQVINSLLSLVSHKVNDSRTKEILEESRNRVLSMAIVHEQLYRTRNFAAIDLGEYLEAVARSQWLNSATNPENIRINFTIKEVVIDIDRAIPCGLIVNELMSNALRHGVKKNGHIEFAVSELDGIITIHIEDNGPGLPPGLDPMHAKTLGFELVQVLLSQLDGALAVNNQKGASFTVTFPKESEFV
jgi:two-component sensor histidine kinase